MTRGLIAIGIACFALGIAASEQARWIGGATSLRDLVAFAAPRPSVAPKSEQTGYGAKVRVALSHPALPTASTFASGSWAAGDRWEFASYGTPTDRLSLSVAVGWNRSGRSSGDLVAGLRGLNIFEEYKMILGERIDLPDVPDLPLRALRFEVAAGGLSRRCIGFDGHGGPRATYVRGWACGESELSTEWLACTLHTLELDGHVVAGPEGCRAEQTEGAA